MGPALEVHALDVEEAHDAEEEQIPSPEREAREGRRRTPASAKPKAKKRPTAYVADDCKQYWFAYEAMARERWGWDTATSFRAMQRLAPEIYGGCHVDTPRKWRKTSRNASSRESGAGRPPVLDEAVLHHLGELCHPVSAKMPVSTSTMSAIMKAELRQLGKDFNPSPTWAKRFLRACRMRFRRATPSSASAQSHGDQIAAQVNLKRKIRFLLDHHGLESHRVANTDETWLRLLPLADRGWGEPGRQPEHCPGAGQGVTLTLSVSGPQSTFAVCQILFEGKTTAVHPDVELPQPVDVWHSPNHWANEDSLKRVVDQLDRSMQVEEGARNGWLWLLDAAPVHTAASFLRWLREERPWIHPCFVPAGFTAVCQPCDVAFMRSFKSSLRAAAADDFAQQIVSRKSAGDELDTLDIRPTTLRRKLISWVGRALGISPLIFGTTRGRGLFAVPTRTRPFWQPRVRTIAQDCSFAARRGETRRLRICTGVNLPTMVSSRTFPLRRPRPR